MVLIFDENIKSFFSFDNYFDFLELIEKGNYIKIFMLNEMYNLKIYDNFLKNI